MKSSLFYILYICVRFKKKDCTMGRITDGSINIYGKGIDQIDVAKQNRLNNPNGSHTTLGVLGSTLIPQLLSGVLSYAADSNSASGVDSSSKSKTPEEITKEMNAILDKYDSKQGDGNIDANISDLELQIAQKKLVYAKEIKGFESTYKEVTNNQAELKKKNKESQNLGAKIENKSAEIKQVSNKITDNTARIENLKKVEYEDNGNGKYVRNEQAAKEISRLEAENSELNAKKEKLEAEKQELETKKANVDKECTNIQSKIETADAERVKQLDELDKAIKEMENDLKNLNVLKGQLKKVEGKDAIEALTNDETDNITKLVKKLTKASSAEDKAACRKELKDALAVYYAKHEKGANKTIDNFAIYFRFFIRFITPVCNYKSFVKG